MWRGWLRRGYGWISKVLVCEGAGWVRTGLGWISKVLLYEGAGWERTGLKSRRVNSGTKKHELGTNPSRKMIGFAI